MRGEGGAGAGCPRCGDVGFLTETREGRDWVRPCPCRRGPDPALPGPRLGACRIPSAFRDSVLSAFEPRTEGARAALELSRAFCRGVPHPGADRGLGLLFWGRDGLGKTRLATAVLACLVQERGLSGRFWDLRALARELGGAFEREGPGEAGPLAAARTVDVLLLDDLGGQRLGDRAFDRLFELLDARYRERRITLATTSCEDGDSEAAARASAVRRQEFLVERVGRRLRSRLLEMCAFVPMEAPAERAREPRAQGPRTLAGLRRRDAS